MSDAEQRVREAREAIQDLWVGMTSASKMRAETALDALILAVFDAGRELGRREAGMTILEDPSWLPKRETKQEER
jgi:hypothetical protein